jgi:hypothetical protein
VYVEVNAPVHAQHIGPFYAERSFGHLLAKHLVKCAEQDPTHAEACYQRCVELIKNCNSRLMKRLKDLAKQGSRAGVSACVNGCASEECFVCYPVYAVCECVSVQVCVCARASACAQMRR